MTQCHDHVTIECLSHINECVSKEILTRADYMRVFNKFDKIVSYWISSERWIINTTVLVFFSDKNQMTCGKLFMILYWTHKTLYYDVLQKISLTRLLNSWKKPWFRHGYMHIFNNFEIGSLDIIWSFAKLLFSFQIRRESLFVVSYSSGKLSFETQL